jgi:hypothetical protein
MVRKEGQWSGTQFLLKKKHSSRAYNKLYYKQCYKSFQACIMTIFVTCAIFITCKTYKPDFISHSQKLSSETLSQSLEKSSSCSMERFAISLSRLALSTGFPPAVGTTLITEMI